jgi:GNAT superfamily N-acetyltransferase
MTLKQLPIKIENVPFNSIINNQDLINRLRKLTLHGEDELDSGMLYELDRLLYEASFRTIDCQLLIVYLEQTVVAWAIFSKEGSDFDFMSGHFESDSGILFELYVDPDYRRCGIGSTLIKKAKQQAGDQKLVVSPWDSSSSHFFSKFAEFQLKFI